MAYHPCGFFHVSSDPMFSIYSRTGRNGMAYHQFGFFHFSSSDLMFSVYTLWYQIEVMYQIVVTQYQKCQNNSSYVLNSSYCGPIFQNLIEVTYLVRKICRAIVDISINFWYLLGKLCRITINKVKPLSVLASNKESAILFY